MRRTVVYAGTSNLFDSMRVALKSLLTNNRIDQVYLLTDQDYPYPLPENVKTVNVSGQTYFPHSGANYHSKWTYMTLMRAALAKLFPDEKRVLWLDCDTIVDADISDLFEMDMGENYFAGVIEPKKSTDQPYINAGVLLMNLEQIRKDTFDDLFINILNREPLKFPDQDAINLLAQGKILTIPSAYNVCLWTEQTETRKIIHYAGYNVFKFEPEYRKYDTDRKTGELRTLIAIPCFDMVNTEFMQSVIDLEKPAGTSYSVIKNTMIYIARNIFAGNAIQAGFDRVFWMDSDMSFPPDALVKLSQVMDDTGADLVTGLYFTRKPPIKPVVYDSLWWKPHEKGIDAGAYNMWAYPDNDIAKIKSCGFGCCLTSVDLIKRIGDRFGSPFTPLDGLGEDMAFCLRANELGATMLVDTSVKCGHIGYMEYNEIYYRKQGKPNES